MPIEGGAERRLEAQRNREEVERKRRKARVTKEAILNVLPITREDAITVRAIARGLPDITKQSIATNIGLLRQSGRCDSERCNFGVGDTRNVYWKSKKRLRIQQFDNLILDMIRKDGILSAPEIGNKLVGLGYTYHTKTVREHLNKGIANGTLVLSHGGHGAHNRYILNDSPDVMEAHTQNVRAVIKEHLPRAEEEAITSIELHAISKEYKFASITTKLSNMYLLGEIKRRGTIPFRYWIEPTEGEAEEPTRRSQDSLIDKTYVNVTTQATPHVEEQEILARIKAVEGDIANIHKRYEKVELALKRKELDARLKRTEALRDEEGKRLERLENELKKWSADDVDLTAGILK